MEEWIKMAEKYLESPNLKIHYNIFGTKFIYLTDTLRIKNVFFSYSYTLQRQYNKHWFTVSIQFDLDDFVLTVARLLAHSSIFCQLNR